MSLRFTLRQLEYLVAVGMTGTIATASKKINVSSPSISAAIGQLEAEFGIQIFVRHHARGLSLTPGGRRFFNEAKLILDNASSLDNLASDITTSTRGSISIGVFSTIASLLSASVRRSFEKKFPDASVILREGNQTDLLRMLGRAEIDVAITYDLEIPRDISFCPLVSLPPFVMLKHNHSLTRKKEIFLHDLEDERMILLDLPLSKEYFLSIFHSAGIKPHIVELTSQLSVARSLAANGFGFSLINMKTKTKNAPDGEKLAFLPLSGDLRPMVLGVITKQTEHSSRIVQAFLEHVKTRVKNNDLPGISENI